MDDENFDPTQYPLQQVTSWEELVSFPDIFYRRLEIPITINKSHSIQSVACRYLIDIFEGIIFYHIKKVKNLTIIFNSNSKTFKIDNDFLPKGFHIPFPARFTEIIVEIECVEGSPDESVECGLVCGIFGGDDHPCSGHRMYSSRYIEFEHDGKVYAMCAHDGIVCWVDRDHENIQGIIKHFGTKYALNPSENLIYHVSR